MNSKLVNLLLIGFLVTCCAKPPEDSPKYKGNIYSITEGNYQFRMNDDDRIDHIIQLASINGLPQDYTKPFYLNSIKLMYDLCNQQTIKFVNQEDKYTTAIYTDSKVRIERGVLYCQNEDIAEVYLKNGYSDANVNENFSQSYFKIQQTAKDQKLGIWANN